MPSVNPTSQPGGPLSTASGAPTTTPPTPGPDINPINPPAQKTLIYSPEIRIVIAHGGIEYDVSADIVRCSVFRKENSASSLQFMLANKVDPNTGAPRYNGLFEPMDRVTVFMKRLDWIQTFSGYLDTVPFKQLYPGVVAFAATCTLKRLLYTWFNPALPACVPLFNQFQSGKDAENGGIGETTNALDSNLGNLLAQFLIQIGGWNPLNIQIQNFPTGMWSLFGDLFANNLKQRGAQNYEKFQHLLLGDNISSGLGAAAGVQPSAGQPGSYSLKGAAAYLAEVIATVDEAGLGVHTSDITTNQNLATATDPGQADTQLKNIPNKTSWTNTSQVYSGAVAQERNSDAAILCAACIMTESTFLMYANYNDPESMSLPHDAVGHDGTSVGLYQQQNFPEWGTTQQRMNVRQSTRMFLNELVRQDWRNMDPARAIQAVQRSAFADGSNYAANIPAATTLVQTYRAGQGQDNTSAISAIPGVGNAVSSVQGALGGSGSSTAPGAGIIGAAMNATTTPATPLGTPSLLPDRPNPDSEGAINWMMTQLGKPYIWGGRGPEGYDCASFLEFGFRSIGVNIGSGTFTQQTTGQSISWESIQRGDAVQVENGNHTVLWLGNGLILEAATTGVPLHMVPAYMSPAGTTSETRISGIYRYCKNGGVNPAAPFSPPETVGPGNPPGALTGSGSVSSGAGDQVGRNIYDYMFDPTASIDSQAYAILRGDEAFINGQPLIQVIQGIAGSSLRNFASAPNGDFIAYYPDYWGLDGKPAVMDLEDIELKDVTMMLSDDPLTTHVYVNGNVYPGVGGDIDEIGGWLRTAGVVTVEDDALFQRILKVVPGDPELLSGKAILSKYGIRPFKQTYGMIGSAELEFLVALQVFLMKWCQRHQTSISMTFMPELFPGMRVNLVGHNLQVYVTEVTHHCDYETGFHTEAVIMAPSNPGAKNLLSPGSPSGTPNKSPNTTPGQMPPTFTF